MIKILKEDNEYQSGRYEFIKSKSVLDYDGFTTDYSLYYDRITDTYFTMLGDTDLYEPDIVYADFESDNKNNAIDWFNHYNGFEDFEDD